jgi:ribosome-binding factor A
MARTEKGAKGTGLVSHRLERVEKEIRDVVGTYLIGGFRGHGLPGLVSLTRVRLSPDMKIANFNFTVLLAQNEGETNEAHEKRLVAARRESEKILNGAAIDFQDEIAHRLKMRFTPRVRFYYDEGFENALKVEKILRDMSVTAGRGEDLPTTEFTEGATPNSKSNSKSNSENE